MNSKRLNERSATDDGHEKRRVQLFAFLFALVSTLAAVDLISDIEEGASASHWAIEGALLAAGLAGLVVMVRAMFLLSDRAKILEVETLSLSERLRAKAAETHSLRDQLLKTAADADQWRAEARDLVQGLGVAIDAQFNAWSLTDAEKEVGLLLLKGLSHKEIAAVRDTSDATTRQQARAVYKKAGLSGRNDLSAFFLEDLMLPVASQEPKR